jgi:hypothetical protein
VGSNVGDGGVSIGLIGGVGLTVGTGGVSMGLIVGSGVTVGTKEGVIVGEGGATVSVTVGSIGFHGFRLKNAVSAASNALNTITINAHKYLRILIHNSSVFIYPSFYRHRLANCTFAVPRERSLKPMQRIR